MSGVTGRHRHAAVPLLPVSRAMRHGSAASTGDSHPNERHLYAPSGNFNLTVVPLSGCELRSTSPPLWRTNP